MNILSIFALQSQKRLEITNNRDIIMTFLGGTNESLEVVFAETTGLLYRQSVGRNRILLNKSKSEEYSQGDF